MDRKRKNMIGAVFSCLCISCCLVSSVAVDNIPITVTSGQIVNFTCTSTSRSILFHHVQLNRCFTPTFGTTLVLNVTLMFRGNLQCFDERLSPNCNESFPLKTISTNWYLTIFYPPTLTGKRFGDLLGTSLSVVTCPLTGYPWPSYTWGKLTNLSDFSGDCKRCDPAVIQEEEEVYLQNLTPDCKNPDHSLVEQKGSINGNIQAVGLPGRQTANGCYFCRAKNKFGEETYKFIVDLHSVRPSGSTIVIGTSVTSSQSTSTSNMPLIISLSIGGSLFVGLIVLKLGKALRRSGILGGFASKESASKDCRKDNSSATQFDKEEGNDSLDSVDLTLFQQSGKDGHESPDVTDQYHHRQQTSDRGQMISSQPIQVEKENRQHKQLPQNNLLVDQDVSVDHQRQPLIDHSPIFATL